MRHRHGFKKLGTDHIHRKALLKNMAVALIKHERIMTTLTKAKELRRTGDKMITLAKRDNVGSRKTAWTWMRHPALMDKLFGPLKKRYLFRPGGYTRVLRAPKRKGDNAPMAVVELVGNRFPPLREVWEAPSQTSLLTHQERRKKLLENPEMLSEALSSKFSKLNLDTSSSSGDVEPESESVTQDEASSSQNLKFARAGKKDIKPELESSQDEASNSQNVKFAQASNKSIKPDLSTQDRASSSQNLKSAQAGNKELGKDEGTPV